VVDSLDRAELAATPSVRGNGSPSRVWTSSHPPSYRNRQVVQELKAGNRLGCGHLIEMYQDRLLGEAVNVFHLAKQDAEELVSDVLLLVVNGIQVFEFKKSDADFHFWLMAIFRNKVRDFARHQALTEGMMESFQESALEEQGAFSGTELRVTREIMRQYRDSLLDGEPGATAKKLQCISETLDKMETWERVLLRCRALDIPYEEIAVYTEKSAKQLKVYHARVKEKFIHLLAQLHPELKVNET